MTRRLRLLRGAVDDIAAAASWYEGHRPALRSAFRARIARLLRRIAEHPHEFPAVQGDVRRGLVKNFPYSVYFSADEHQVNILAVIHLHRHPESWKRGG